MSSLRVIGPIVLTMVGMPGGVPVLGARQGAEPVKKAADAADGSRRQAFSVVLLLGDMQGGESLDGVPAAARKALADTKDFLPYKNYRLLDSQWTLCCSGTTSAITRLRGLDDQQYELELRANPIVAAGATEFESGALSIRFFLRELSDTGAGSSKLGDRSREPTGKMSAATSVEPPARAAQISDQLFNLEREEFGLKSEAAIQRGRVDVGLADPEKLRRIEGELALVRQRIASLKNELNTTTGAKLGVGVKAVIDTSFRMDIGETVVVGTSGLRGGNRALIALLTAVAKSPKQR